MLIKPRLIRTKSNSIQKTGICLSCHVMMYSCFVCLNQRSQLLDELSTVKLVSNKENIDAYLKSVC